MTFNKLGGIYYNETTEVIPLGYGGSIPCFIGRTINPQKDWTEEAKASLIAKNNAKETPEPNYKPTQDEINTEIPLVKQAEIDKHKINELLVFNNFAQVNKTTLDSNGKLEGLGDYDNEKLDNPLLKVIHDFCEETKLMTEEYVACPYFYVIDLGEAKNISDWINSIETSKLKREIDFEIYVGFDGVKDTQIVNGTSTQVDASYEGFILAINNDLVTNRQVIGDFRKAFYTIPLKVNSETHKYEDDTYYKDTTKDTTTGKLKYQLIDEELITLAKALTSNNDSKFTVDQQTQLYNGIGNETTNTISKSRTYLIEPLHFGRTIGRITTTPYDMEPGYYQYNTLGIDDIILRKPSEQLKLQIAGVIFNHLEETSSEEYVKINRTQAVSSNLINHPADSLFQARHLTDHLVEKIFDAVYPQIKNKETETNLTYLQTQVNKIVGDSIKDGDFIPPYMDGTTQKGTFLTVQESTEDAYDIEVVGMIQPVNCTYSIHIIAQINDAKVNVIQS